MHTTSNTELWLDIAWAAGSIALTLLAFWGIFSRIGLGRLLGASVAVSAADELYKESKKPAPELGDAALRGAAIGIGVWLALICAGPIAIYHNTVVPYLLRNDDASRAFCCVTGDSAPSVAFFGEGADWMMVNSYDAGSEVFQLANLNDGVFIKWPIGNGWRAEFPVSKKQLEDWVEKEPDREAAYKDLLQWVPRYLPLSEAGVRTLPRRWQRGNHAVTYLAHATKLPAGYSQRNRVEEGKVELELSEYDHSFTVATKAGMRKTIEAGADAICAKIAPNGSMAAVIYPATKHSGFFSRLFDSGQGHIDILDLRTEALQRFVVGRFWGNGCSAAYGLYPSENGRRWVFVQERLVKVFDLAPKR